MTTRCGRGPGLCGGLTRAPNVRSSDLALRPHQRRGEAPHTQAAHSPRGMAEGHPQHLGGRSLELALTSGSAKSLTVTGSSTAYENPPAASRGARSSRRSCCGSPEGWTTGRRPVPHDHALRAGGKPSKYQIPGPPETLYRAEDRASIIDQYALESRPGAGVRNRALGRRHDRRGALPLGEGTVAVHPNLIGWNLVSGDHRSVPPIACCAALGRASRRPGVQLPQLV